MASILPSLDRESLHLLYYVRRNKIWILFDENLSLLCFGCHSAIKLQSPPITSYIPTKRDNIVIFNLFFILLIGKVFLIIRVSSAYFYHAVNEYFFVLSSFVLQLSKVFLALLNSLSVPHASFSIPLSLSSSILKDFRKYL